MKATLITRVTSSVDTCINCIGKRTNTSSKGVESLRGEIAKFVASFSRTLDDLSVTLDLQSNTLLNVILTSRRDEIKKRYSSQFIKEGDTWHQVQNCFDPRLRVTLR